MCQNARLCTSFLVTILPWGETEEKECVSVVLSPEVFFTNTQVCSTGACRLIFLVKTAHHLSTSFNKWKVQQLFKLQMCIAV